MTTTQETTDLAPLAERYDLIGELGGRRDTRTIIARRRDTGEDVLISVIHPPAGDEGNALSHFASDAQRLASQSHRNVVRVLEAHWLDSDALAVVREKVPFPTLEDLLVRRDEAFSCPRVALILQEVNAALEWARGERIVHRAVDPANIYVEPGSDRVFLTFLPRALPRADMPGAEEDARTIASLARAMLTRSVADPERDRVPLRELRPGLPDRLIDQTDEILALAPHHKAPDMSEYIAVVAMADNLKRAETECAITTAKLLEEERLAREKIEAERQATERAAAEQARLFQLERDEFAKERENILAELQKQREALERERALLAREREEHERDRQLLAREREEHRRWADQAEKAFAAQAAAFEEQVRVAREEQLRALREAEEARALALTETQEQAAHRPAVPVAISRPATPFPARPKQHRPRPEWVRWISNRAAIAWERRPSWNRRWNRAVAAAAVLLLVIVSAVAIARGRDGDAAAPAVATAPPAGTVVDSAAGRVASPAVPRAGAVGIPADFVSSVSRVREAGVPADLIAGVRARAASTGDEAPAASQEATPMLPQRVRPAPRRVAVDSGPGTEASRAQSQRAPARDTVAPVTPFFPIPAPPTPRPDTPRPDTTRPRPDTLRAAW